MQGMSAWFPRISQGECVYCRCTLNLTCRGSLEKFEGIDPGLWVAKGYAVINIDARGVGNSDGYVCIMGKQDAEDGHDAIEAIAKLPWCNGAVGMAGNSALAICQWHIAATQPPSLKAIAPWEGSGDLYREQFCRGRNGFALTWNIR